MKDSLARTNKQTGFRYENFATTTAIPLQSNTLRAKRRERRSHQSTLHTSPSLQAHCYHSLVCAGSLQASALRVHTYFLDHRPRVESLPNCVNGLPLTTLTAIGATLAAIGAAFASFLGNETTAKGRKTIRRSVTQYIQDDERMTDCSYQAVKHPRSFFCFTTTC